MRIPIYVIDSFTSRLFSGNPAAVCPLERWLEDDTLRSIAAENGFSETAFYVAKPEGYDLRWFTPTVEVDLCGHATLASAHVLLTYKLPNADTVEFDTRSGRLTVSKEGTLLSMDFPARAISGVMRDDSLRLALGKEPNETYESGKNLLAVFDSETEIKNLEPRFDRIAELEFSGVIVSARGDKVDFVSRFFGPRAGIPEDPVTGSAHCTLIPFWSTRLQKSKLHARQLSARGGDLYCEARGDRVKIAGQAVTYSQGFIDLPAAAVST